MVVYTGRGGNEIANLNKYLKDLEESLFGELVQFTELLKTDLASHSGTLDLVELYFLSIDN